jgi:3-oxoacyl-[acyl-carrier protein] reductase
MDDSDWDTALEANLRGSVRLVRAFLSGMVARRSGSIILVGSIAGLEASSAPLPYSAAKAALVSYSKNLSRQVGPEGVRVNVVAPGNVLFPGGSWERRQLEDPVAVSRMLEMEVPLKRFGTPQEIADLVVFLASDRAGFITGACFVADGGQTRIA